jgi:MFS family permease
MTTQPSTEPPGSGSVRLDERQLFRIGSALGNDLGVDNPLLEPRHAQVERFEGRLRLTAIAGETLLNDMPVTGSVWLTIGDSVRAGSIRLTIGDGDEVQYRDRGAGLLMGSRRGRSVPDRLLSRMSYGGIPGEPSRPLTLPTTELRPSMWAAFRNRSFLLMWIGQFVSTFGNGLALVASSILVYRLTSSALSVGLLAIATALPSLGVGLVAGVFVDRFDRKRIMVACELSRAVLYCLIPLLVPISIVWLYALVLLASAVGQFFDPAHASVLPEVVGDEELSASNALMEVAISGAELLGLAFAGLIVAYLSVEWAFYLDALTFLISGLCILGVRVAPVALQEAPRVAEVFNDLRDGVRFLLDTPVLRSLFLVYLPIFISFGLTNALALPFMAQVLGGGDVEYGLLLSLEAGGFLLGSLLVARFTERLHQGQWIAISILGMAAFEFAFALNSVIPLALALGACAGLCNVPSVLARQLIIQRHTPREIRGRVSSAFFVTRDTVFLIGMAAVGLADIVSPRLLYFGAGCALLAGGIMALVLPGLRQPLAEWRQIGQRIRSEPTPVVELSR